MPQKRKSGKKKVYHQDLRHRARTESKVAVGDDDAEETENTDESETIQESFGKTNLNSFPSSSGSSEENNSVDQVIGLLNSDNVMLQEQAAVQLRNLVSSSVHYKVEICRKGGVAALVNILHREVVSNSGRISLLEAMLTAFCVVTISCEEAVDELRSERNFMKLLSMIDRTSVVKILKSLLMIVHIMIKKSDEGKRMFVKLGGIPLMLSLLSHRAKREEWVEAMKVLLCISPSDIQDTRFHKMIKQTFLAASGFEIVTNTLLVPADISTTFEVFVLQFVTSLSASIFMDISLSNSQVQIFIATAVRILRIWRSIDSDVRLMCLGVITNVLHCKADEQHMDFCQDSLQDVSAFSVLIDMASLPDQRDKDELFLIVCILREMEYTSKYKAMMQDMLRAGALPALVKLYNFLPLADVREIVVHTICLLLLHPASFIDKNTKLHGVIPVLINRLCQLGDENVGKRQKQTFISYEGNRLPIDREVNAIPELVCMILGQCLEDVDIRTRVEVGRATLSALLIVLKTGGSLEKRILAATVLKEVLCLNTYSHIIFECSSSEDQKCKEDMEGLVVTFCQSQGIQGLTSCLREVHGRSYFRQAPSIKLAWYVLLNTMLVSSESRQSIQDIFRVEDGISVGVTYLPDSRSSASDDEAFTIWYIILKTLTLAMKGNRRNQKEFIKVGGLQVLARELNENYSARKNVGAKKEDVALILHILGFMLLFVESPENSKAGDTFLASGIMKYVCDMFRHAPAVYRSVVVYQTTLLHTANSNYWWNPLRFACLTLMTAIIDHHPPSLEYLLTHSTNILPLLTQLATLYALPDLTTQTKLLHNPEDVDIRSYPTRNVNNLKLIVGDVFMHIFTNIAEYLSNKNELGKIYSTGLTDVLLNWLTHCEALLTNSEVYSSATSSSIYVASSRKLEKLVSWMHTPQRYTVFYDEKLCSFFSMLLQLVNSLSDYSEESRVKYTIEPKSEAQGPHSRLYTAIEHFQSLTTSSNAFGTSESSFVIYWYGITDTADDMVDTSNTGKRSEKQEEVLVEYEKKLIHTANELKAKCH